MNLLRRKPDTQEIVQQAVTQVLAELPAAMQSHRMIDLDAPFDLNPRPLIEFRDGQIKHSLKRLFENKYFNICLFDSMVELARIYPPKELLKTLRPLHCVDWTDMEPEFRSQIQQHIIACFIPVEAEANIITEQEPES